MKKILAKFGLVAALLVAAVSVRAATYTNDNIGGTNGFPAYAGNKLFVLEASVDFSAQNVITGDVVQAIAVPANTRVLFVNAEIVTATTTNVGANHTIKIGDGSDDDGWVTSLSTVTAGTDAGSNASLTSTPTLQTFTSNSIVLVTNLTIASVSSPAYGLGKTYTAYDTLDLVSNGNHTDGVVRVRAVVADVSQLR